MNQDLAIYALYQLGVYRNEEIGRLFGVRYTAVTAVLNRAPNYLREDSRDEMIIKETLNDK